MMRLQVIGGLAKPSVVYTHSQANAATITNWNLTGIDIGAEPAGASDRLVVVTPMAFSGFNRTVSVTVGGVGATQAAFTAGGGDHAGVYGAVVNSGTTADISISWSGSVNGQAIGVWAVYNLRSATATAGDADNNIAAESGMSAAVEANGVAIACAYGTSAISGWSTLSEDFDFLADATRWAGASAAQLPAGIVTETPTSTALGAIAIATWR